MATKRKATKQPLPPQQKLSKETKLNLKPPQPPPPPPVPSSDESESSTESESNTESESKSGSESGSEDVKEVLQVEDDDSSSESEESEDEDDENSKLETIKQILQSFSKNELINIVKEAAAADPSIAAQLIASVESDFIHRKIFVHGLGWDATNETLISVFKEYGPIEECNVVIDKTTGRCKGFGFVVFKTRVAARKSLKQPHKKIGSRIATCNLATLGRGQQVQQQNSDANERKLYIANVGPQISAEKLRAFFSKFGEIDGGPTGFDKITGKFKGFAFIVYKNIEGMKKALEEPTKVLDGITLHCSVAIRKNNNVNNITTKTINVEDEVGAGGLNMMNSANASMVPSNVAMTGLPGGLDPMSAILLGQNHQLGFLNPVLGLLNHTGLSQPFGGGVLQPLNGDGNSGTGNPVGLTSGITLLPRVNTVSPSIIGNYGSPGPLQGLGAYQTSKLGQPSSSAAMSTSQSSYSGTRKA